MEETEMESTYWNGNGKHQEDYERLFDELVPNEGPAKSLQGEVLRAASRLYYRYYNDGEIVKYGMCKFELSSVENAWGFLHRLRFDYRDSLLDSISMTVESLAKINSDDIDMIFLEALVNSAIEYAGTRPLVPFDGDMLDDKYAQHCEDVCGLTDEDTDEDTDE